MPEKDKITTQYSGRVKKEKVLPGSKNEHEAFVLETAEGSYRLKRIGGNPYYDDMFENYLNKEVLIEGIKKISYLQVHKIEEKS